MGKIVTSKGNKKKKTSKNSVSGTKRREKGSKISRYVNHLREPDVYPYSNKSELYKKFQDEYSKFFKLWLETFMFLPQSQQMKTVNSKEFKQFYSSLNSQLTKGMKVLDVKDSNTKREKILKALTNYTIMKINYRQLIETLPRQARAGFQETLEPQFNILKGFLDNMKDLDPVLHKISKKALAISHYDLIPDENEDSTKSAF